MQSIIQDPFSIQTIQMINSHYSLDALFTLIAWGRFKHFDFLLPLVSLENIDQLIALLQKVNITLVYGHDPDPVGFAQKKQNSMINLDTTFDIPKCDSSFTIIYGNLDIKIAIKKLLDQLSQPSPVNIELLLAEAGISDDVLLALNLKIENEKIVSPLFQIAITNNEAAQRLMNYISFKKEIIAAQDFKIRIAKDSIALINKAPLIKPKEIENSLVSLEPGALSWQILLQSQKDQKESKQIIQSHSCTI